jgi:hypothetical protein
VWEKPLQVGVVMAGNVPLVGIHDYLSVLLAGHHLLAKPSAKDEYLMNWAHGLLQKAAPALAARAKFVERLVGADAIIATGSNNSARYFEYYFGKVPNIIRRNRVACAVIRGDETEQELLALGEDVFTYYGLGCRNVAKLFVPQGYDFVQLLGLWTPMGNQAMNNHKYANNYEYNRAVYLVNQVPHLDNGSLLLRDNEGLSSPAAVLHTAHYAEALALAKAMETLKGDIQCIVSAGGWFQGSLPFGQAQKPEAWDYADGVDTLRFLLER